MVDCHPSDVQNQSSRVLGSEFPICNSWTLGPERRNDVDVFSQGCHPTTREWHRPQGKHSFLIGQDRLRISGGFYRKGPQEMWSAYFIEQLKVPCEQKLCCCMPLSVGQTRVESVFSPFLFRKLDGFFLLGAFFVVQHFRTVCPTFYWTLSLLYCTRSAGMFDNTARGCFVKSQYVYGWSWLQVPHRSCA